MPEEEGQHAMPELPEVQSIVDTLNHQGVVGRTITAATVHWPGSIAAPLPGAFCEAIAGLTIGGISRRGKYIVMGLSRGLSLLIHLRMSGRLNWEPRQQPRHPHEHVILHFGPVDTLRFQDARKFGRIWLTDRPEKILDPLGPEPLEKGFTRRRLGQMLQSANRQIKPLLLDQRVLAGLGNIYVDEALWAAGIHPLRLSRSLDPREIGRLHRAIPQVLLQAIANRGTSLGGGQANFHLPGKQVGRHADALRVFRRTGQACGRCGTAIVRIVVGQRGSHVCPRCQPAPS